MAIGTVFLGAVHRMGGECVKTKFLVVGVPLVPLASFYFAAYGPGANDAFEIPLCRSSVVAGYLRTYALLTTVGAILAFALFGTMTWLWVAGVGVAALGVGFLVVGRLSPEQASRRELLRRATSIGAPPELMLASTRRVILGRLVQEWRRDYGHGDWTVRAEQAAEVGDEFRLLHALAEYAHQPLLAAELRGRSARGSFPA